MALWPSVTPSHREIAAAHIQPMIAGAADQDRSGGTETLPALARCSGPFGPAMALALAYGLAAKRERDRLPAVDALVHLAGRGELARPAATASQLTDPAAVAGRLTDPAAVAGRELAGPGAMAGQGEPGGRGELAGPLLGRALGELTGEGVVVLSRVVAALGEAARAGAAGTVWHITAAMLPTLLTQDKPRSGTPDLLALAALTAESTPAEPDPDLRALVTAVAARKGTSRLVTEANRLSRALG
jgi:hypothetical protein